MIAMSALLQWLVLIIVPATVVLYGVLAIYAARQKVQSDDSG